MDKELILETSFLIDLQRQAGQKRAGAAERFLETKSETLLFVTFTIAGEFACGISMSNREKWEAFLKPFHVLPWTPDVSWQYGHLYRYLSKNRMLIGSNDLWIAATAIAYEIPLVTRNTAHYDRVPDLKVISYTF